MVKIGVAYIYGSYRKTKTGVPLLLEHPVYGDNFTEAGESVSMVTGPAAAAVASISVDAVGVSATSAVMSCTFVHVCIFYMHIHCRICRCVFNPSNGYRSLVRRVTGPTFMSSVRIK